MYYLKNNFKFVNQMIMMLGLLGLSNLLYAGFGAIEDDNIKLWGSKNISIYYKNNVPANFGYKDANGDFINITYETMDIEIEKAIAEFEAKTSFSFEITHVKPDLKANGDIPEFIEIVFDETIEGGCYSDSIGYNKHSDPYFNGEDRNYNQIILSQACRGVHIAHELFHALGMFHEHVRPDRDNYIKTYDYDDGRMNKNYYFKILGPYDAHSIVHYSSSTVLDENENPILDVNGNTIDSIVHLNGEVVEPYTFVNVPHSEYGLTQEDINSLERLYDDIAKDMIYVPDLNFYISNHEVTLGEYKRYGQIGSPGNCWYYTNLNDCSVSNVSWNDAQEYIENLNATDPFPNGQYRLCSTEEWDTAASFGEYEGGYSGTQELFDYSDQNDFTYFCGNSTSCLQNSAIYNANSLISNYLYTRSFYDLKNNIANPGFKPNSLQVWNLYGNVSEWLLDDFGGTNSRGLRGGSFAHDSSGMQRNIIWYAPPTSKSKYDGIRVCAVSVTNEIDSMVKIKEDSSKGIYSPFYISDHEVTVGEYNNIARQTSALSDKNSYRCEGEDCPVVNISYEEVQNFLHELNSLSTVNGPFNNGADYRLCSADEWNHAVTAGSQGEYFCDIDGTQGASCLNDYAYFSSNSSSKIHHVRHKRPNLNGLYDMGGNVWEWVDSTILKGGSVFSSSGSLKTNYKLQMSSATSKYSSVGFRICADY